MVAFEIELLKLIQGHEDFILELADLIRKYKLSLKENTLVPLDLIKKHEGFRGLPYLDTTGHLTIGYGRNLDAEGLNGTEWTEILTCPITDAQAVYLLSNDINKVIAWLSQYSWWNSLTINRKSCIIDMGFNLGEGGFKQFTHMISALEIGDYNEAANQMASSTWAAQVHQRAKDDIDLMIKG